MQIHQEDSGDIDLSEISSQTFRPVALASTGPSGERIETNDVVRETPCQRYGEGRDRDSIASEGGFRGLEWRKGGL